jgi:hypothetical protein
MNRTRFSELLGDLAAPSPDDMLFFSSGDRQDQLAEFFAEFGTEQRLRCGPTAQFAYVNACKSATGQRDDSLLSRPNFSLGTNEEPIAHAQRPALAFRSGVGATSIYVVDASGERAGYPPVALRPRSRPAAAV